MKEVGWYNTAVETQVLLEEEKELWLNSVLLKNNEIEFNLLVVYKRNGFYQDSSIHSNFFFFHLFGWQQSTLYFYVQIQLLLAFHNRDAYIHPQFVTDVMKPLMIESIIDQEVCIWNHLSLVSKFLRMKVYFHLLFFLYI
jgi:hypothetical protein